MSVNERSGVALDPPAVPDLDPSETTRVRETE